MSVKPMNCPGHFLLYASQVHSYQRAADPVSRADAAASQRSLRRAVGTDARPAVLAGRCALLRDAGADRRRSRAADSAGAARLRRFRPAVHGEAVDDARRSSSATIATWDHAEAQLKAALDRAGMAYTINERRRRVLRPEDRLRRHRRDRPQVAVRDDSARLPAAGELRPEVRRRRQRRASAGGDPPRDLRQLRAVHRDPDRALCGRVSAVAGAGAGDRAADCRPAPAVRRVRARSAEGRRAARRPRRPPGKDRI